LLFPMVSCMVSEYPCGPLAIIVSLYQYRRSIRIAGILRKIMLIPSKVIGNIPFDEHIHAMRESQQIQHTQPTDHFISRVLPFNSHMQQTERMSGTNMPII
jgi:hypothetical protein